MNGKRTIAQRIAEVGPAADTRLGPRFEAAGCPYPPSACTLVGLKEERLLELHAPGTDGRWRLVHTYPVLAASGGPGPKLREGDRQVPEGIYRVESLNPNSRFHLSLRLDYPNADDRERARADGREALGGDIMIHGAAVSVGCLAMGDPAAEELFVLAERTGIANVTVILAPRDLRVLTAPAVDGMPSWVAQRWSAIAAALASLSR